MKLLAKRTALYFFLIPGLWPAKSILAGAGWLSRDWPTGPIDIPCVAGTGVFDLGMQMLAMVAMAGAVGLAVSQYAARKAAERFRELAERQAKQAEQLHDTMLQGFLGVVWQIEAATAQLPAQPGETKEQINHLMLRLDGVLQEARQSIWDLRQTSAETVELPERLAIWREEMFPVGGPQCLVVQEGDERPILPEICHGIGYIIREAWMNALRHAQAKVVKTTLRFADDRFEVEVRDDGVGMTEQTRSLRPGQWGIACMRQLAARMGAEFQLESQDGAGTVVVVRLRAEQAYGGDSREPVWKRLRFGPKASGRKP